jgi:arylsulfatase A-like enzyme
VSDAIFATIDFMPTFVEKPHFLGGRSSGAIRQGDWKLIEFFDTGTIELYNLAHDPGEQDDLADRHPDKSAELARRLARSRAPGATPRASR